MIQWVYERAKRARGIAATVVATDDERIAQAVRAFGGEVVMTSADINSGTDRVAAVADVIPADVYVNVQGDEPMIEPTAIEKALELVTSGRFSMSTLMTPIKAMEELANMAVVKVITDKTGKAIYFSRYPIPYSRKAAPDAGESFVCMRHIGLYVYTRDILFRIRSLPQTAIEKAELLEQLRALHDGISIGVAEVPFASIGVDTPEELEKARRLLV